MGVKEMQIHELLWVPGKKKKQLLNLYINISGEGEPDKIYDSPLKGLKHSFYLDELSSQKNNWKTAFCSYFKCFWKIKLNKIKNI